MNHSGKKRTRRAPAAASARSVTPIEMDPRPAVDMVMRLMAIPGTSGQESAVAEAVVARLRDAGVPAAWMHHDRSHRRTPSAGEVGNLVVKFPGTHRAPRRMFSAHLDTVPICVGARPRRKGTTIVARDSTTGLGADDRAGVAVILNAALELVRRDLPHPPLTFCWFIQEETGLHGSRLVNRTLLGKPKLAFNWDGGAPDKLTVGATGGYRMAIQVHGIASHAGGAPEQGVSAISVAALAIADLQQRGWHGLIRQGAGAGTSNVGVMHGGNATNIVTDHVVLRAEARSHDTRFRERIVNEMRRAFQRAARHVRNDSGQTATIDFDGRLDYESFRLPDDEPSVLAAEAAVQAIGREPQRAIANGGIDANWTFRHGIPAVTLGCGQRHPHTVHESLDVPDFEDACRIALQLAVG